MLGVLVLDAHDLMRRGIADTIDSAAGMRVVAEAATARQALARAAATMPDVAVLDATPPDGSGAELCRALRTLHPRLRCLVLAMTVDDAIRDAAAAAGADGLLTKDLSAPDLIDALRRIAAGHPLTASLRSGSRPLSATPVSTDRIDELSNRQRDVLVLLARGMSNREVAEALGLAEKTVKNHVTALMRTLGTRRRTQAALIALRSGAATGGT